MSFFPDTDTREKQGPDEDCRLRLGDGGRVLGEIGKVTWQVVAASLGVAGSCFGITVMAPQGRQNFVL